MLLLLAILVGSIYFLYTAPSCSEWEKVKKIIDEENSEY